MSKKAPSTAVHIIVHKFNYSGVPHASVTLANTLASKGIATHLVICSETCQSPFDIHNDVDIIFLGVTKSQSFLSKLIYPIRLLVALGQYLLATQPRNIVASAKEIASVVLFLRTILPVRPKIIGIHAIAITAHIQSKQIISRTIYNLFYRNMFPRADHMIAVSSGIAKDLENNFNIPPNKIDVVYPALSQKFFDSHTPLQSNGCNNEILFVGSLNQRKAPDVVLRVFANHVFPHQSGTTLRFLGDGPLLNPLKKEATRLNISDHVIFEGNQPDVESYMRKARILVMTSSFEGLPQVLVEALACGLPLVSYDLPTGPSEIIEDGVNGFLVPYGDEHELGEKMILALEKNWDIKKFPTTIRQFHPDTVLLKYVEVVKKVFSL